MNKYKLRKAKIWAYNSVRIPYNILHMRVIISLSDIYIKSVKGIG